MDRGHYHVTDVNGQESIFDGRDIFAHITEKMDAETTDAGRDHWRLTSCWYSCLLTH